ILGAESCAVGLPHPVSRRSFPGTELGPRPAAEKVSTVRAHGEHARTPGPIELWPPLQSKFCRIPNFFAATQKNQPDIGRRADGRACAMWEWNPAYEIAVHSPQGHRFRVVHKNPIAWRHDHARI